jgi:hypothetical protein
MPSAKDRVHGPACEENLALIQALCGENSRAISIFTRLSQTPYGGILYSPAPVTSALLRLDPMRGPIARRSRFPKTLQGKAALNRRNFCRIKCVVAKIGDPGRAAAAGLREKIPNKKKPR